MPDNPLTKRQSQILEYIDSAIRDKGYPPTVREIGQAVGLNSPSTVHNHLNTPVSYTHLTLPTILLV